MPLLEHARDLKEDAKVMSILAAGQGDGKINVKDLALKEKYSAKKVMLTTPTYTDYAFEVRISLIFVGSLLIDNLVVEIRQSG